MFVVREGQATLGVKQGAVDSIAEAQRNGAEDIRLRTEPEMRARRLTDEALSVDVGPTRLSLNAEHPTVLLDLAADLTTNQAPHGPKPDRSIAPVLAICL
jgi:hypothetical protein